MRLRTKELNTLTENTVSIVHSHSYKYMYTVLYVCNSAITEECIICRVDAVQNLVELCHYSDNIIEFSAVSFQTSALLTRSFTLDEQVLKFYLILWTYNTVYMCASDVPLYCTNTSTKYLYNVFVLYTKCIYIYIFIFIYIYIFIFIFIQPLQRKPFCVTFDLFWTCSRLHSLLQWFYAPGFVWIRRLFLDLWMTLFALTSPDPIVFLLQDIHHNS